MQSLMKKIPLPKVSVQASAQAPVAAQTHQQFAAVGEAELRSKVIDVLQSFLPNGSEGLTDDAEFDELGLDSLSGVEASRTLATTLAPLGIEGIKPTLLFEATSLRTMLCKLASFPRSHQPSLPQVQPQSQICTTPTSLRLTEELPSKMERDLRDTQKASATERMMWGLFAWTLEVIASLCCYLIPTSVMVITIYHFGEPNSLTSLVVFREKFLGVQGNSVTNKPFLVMLYFFWFLTYSSSALFVQWLLKKLFIGKKKPGLVPTWSLAAQVEKVVVALERVNMSRSFDYVFGRTEAGNLWKRLMGADIAPGAYMPTEHMTYHYGWDLLSLGKNSHVETQICENLGPVFNHHEKIVIGENCTLGLNAFITQGIVVGDNSVVLPCARVNEKVPSNSVYDGEKVVMDARDFDAATVRCHPSRTKMSGPAASVFFMLYCCVRAIAMCLVLPDILLLVQAWAQEATSQEQAMSVSKTLLNGLSLTSLIFIGAIAHDVAWILITVFAKWTLLGKLREGSFSASTSWLFRYELVYLCAVQTCQVQLAWGQTILCTVIMKLMGASIPWSWMPSPWRAFSIISADLIKIEQDHFSASKTSPSCIDLKPPDTPDQPWQVTCRPIELKRGSFLGPHTVVKGGAILEEGAATNDCTFVPGGFTVQPWTTLMGSRLRDNLTVKRKRVEPESQPVLPYAICLALGAWNSRTATALNNVFLCFVLADAMVGFVTGSDFSSSTLTSTVLWFLLCATAAAMIRLIVILTSMILVKKLILGTVSKDVSGPFRGVENTKWLITTFMWCACATLLRMFDFTPLITLVHQVCGATVGKNVHASSDSITSGPELDIMILEDDCVAGGNMYGHSFGAGALEYKEVKIECNAQFRNGGLMVPGATVPADVMTYGGAVIIPNCLSTQGSYATGNPAFNSHSAPEAFRHVI